MVDTNYDRGWTEGYNDGLIKAVQWLRTHGHESQAQSLTIEHGLVIDGARQMSIFPFGPELEVFQVPWTIEGKRYVLPMTIRTPMLNARREALRQHGIITPYKHDFTIFTLDYTDVIDVRARLGDVPPLLRSFFVVAAKDVD